MAGQAQVLWIINTDYADFVDMSSNLIGMDHHIDDLHSTLLKLRLEVEVRRH